MYYTAMIREIMVAVLGVTETPANSEEFNSSTRRISE
jgi:hypothetical protein